MTSTSWGCVAVVQREVCEFGRQSAGGERMRRGVSLGRTAHENDRSSGKMTNSSGVKMLEMIPGASGLQIECGLFLWLTSDMERLLEVMDVPCMGCGELDPIHGGGGHG